ncbi:MAG: hypothetical protein ACJAXA_003734 [Candidatus Aldehydirespiratoraceae bacterium]|jgi:hypothetical protein
MQMDRCGEAQAEPMRANQPDAHVESSPDCLVNCAKCNGVNERSLSSITRHWPVSSSLVKGTGGRALPDIRR